MMKPSGLFFELLKGLNGDVETNQNPLSWEII